MKHQGGQISLIRITYIVAVMAGCLTIARAATIWNTVGTGDKTNWFDANNWNPIGVPGDGADVVITNGSVLLTNETAALSSLTITNCILTFSNWMTKVSATNVTVQNLGFITHATNSATNTIDGSWPTEGRVWIVCTNFELQVGGQINANGRGYRGGRAGATDGWGPGRGMSGAWAYNAYGGGGSHGGSGGAGLRSVAGVPYGLTNFITCRTFSGTTNGNSSASIPRFRAYHGILPCKYCV
ncbi:MAG: hypothetical protein PHW60_14280 [Kiritimatiellae bacterium]|nr:hypothetical protein [Kiritimatiellia bacterium]